MSDGFSETGSDLKPTDDTPAYWMGGRTTLPPVISLAEPAMLDPTAVLDAVRRMSDGQRRELAVLLHETGGLLALPPFKAGEVPPEVAEAPAHLKQHNPVW